ncbi:MAG: hypothetical protein JRG86_22015 [Deltaproteobacteria bacterium]|nr:hypothetical protein [Deltaproteobacteria bacterium]
MRERGRLGGLALLLLCLVGCGPSEESGSAEAFCQALRALRAGEIEVGSDDPNEFVGHVASLEALTAVAPAAVREDLERVAETFVRARDAGGWDTLLDFAAMQDPELAGAEGRVAEYADAECGIRDGDLAWSEDRSEAPEPLCEAWPRVGSPLMHNRFPYLLATAAANYFATQLWSVPFVPTPPGFLEVPRGGRVEFKGEYPYARYFAYHPNDYETNNFDTLLDRELDPDPGSVNPWRRPQGAEGGRRYTASLVFDDAPDAPEPNTVYVGRTVSGRWNPAVFLLLRVYAADQGALPPNSAGVKLPSVTIYDRKGEVVAHYEECDPYPEGYEPPVDQTRFPAFPVPDHRAVFHPGEYNAEDNWGLPVTLLGNRDNLYLVLFHSRMHGEIYAVRARMPRTPGRRRGIPLHAEDVDVRLFTVCDYNFWNGRAQSCVVDEDIAVDAEGDYTLVASDEAHRPANATREEGVTWLRTGEFLDGQLTYRWLLSTDPLLQEMRRAVEKGVVSEHVRPFLPEVAQCAKATFEAGGFGACRASWKRQLAKMAGGDEPS